MNKILELVGDTYLESEYYGLHIEVFAFALQYLKDNPTASIEDALNYGLNEWIK